jgi:hypothetical protein
MEVKITTEPVCITFCCLGVAQLLLTLEFTEDTDILLHLSLQT